MGMQMTMAGLLRSEGATKEAMIGVMIGSIMNMILDPILIFTMNMGIGGAALATTIGNILGFSYYLLFYLRKRGIISIARKYFTLQKEYYIQILKIGVPASLSMILMSIGMIVLNVIAAGYGDNVVAAFGIVYRITGLGFMLVLGLAQGCQPLMGYSYGSQNFKRLFDGIKYANIASTVICIIFTAIFFFFAEGWMMIFIKNNEVVELGSKIMRVMMISMPFLGVEVILMILFQAIGKPVQSLVLSLGRQGLFLIPFLLIFSSVWGFNGFISAEPIADIFTTVLAVVLYYAMRKQLIKKAYR